MMDDSRLEAWEQHLDWSLRAIEGGEAPPDVVARVQAIVAGPSGPPAPAWEGRRLLLAAAALIFAIGVVVGVRLLSSPSDGPIDDDVAVPFQGAENHIVDDLEDVEALPADAPWVSVLGHGDEVLEQVATRCPLLQRLDVICIGEGGGQPTNRVFAIAANLAELRHLQLVKTVNVDGTGLDRLLGLPRLETLVIAMTRLEADCFAVLPRLPSLRVLDLSYTHGVGDEALEHIARCPGLHQLGIPGCRDVTADGLRKVAGLRTLEVLEARQLRCAFDDFPIERLDRLVTADLAEAQFAKAWLLRLPASLRKLTLSQSNLDDDGCVVLAGRLRALRDLRVGRTAIGDRGVAALVRIAELRTLDLGGCSAVTAASIEVLRPHERLATLELARERWATPGNVRPLFERGIDVRIHSPADNQALEPLRRRNAKALAARAQ